MKSLIDLSFSTMKEADKIRDGARDCVFRYGKTEQEVSLKIKRIIALLYDDICYWLCSSKGNYSYEVLFNAIINTFVKFIEVDKLEQIFNEQIKRYK